MPLYRDATLADCEAMAPRLREADRQELKAFDGSEPLAALVDSFKASIICRAIDHGGEPIAIYGVAPYDPECSDCTVGVPWMLATDELKTHATWFLRTCKEELVKIQQPYAVLQNFVDVRNQLHIQWVRWCGFTLGEKYPRNGTHFQHIMRLRECVP
ncbi:hypothetical protein [Azorhizobium caulinodans]|uniref:hypothetical protein n=1 Tax=Azorhizobium caulinodans TaxID=7 RepID=UPI00030C467B|nr:hypothetical protein [Azorhizobium caulinodans]